MLFADENAGQLHADVLKIAHHGSAGSTSQRFLAAVGPRMAVISCGAHNPFGHPSPRTLAALTRRGIVVRRTDRDGSVHIILGECDLRFGPN